MTPFKDYWLYFSIKQWIFQGVLKINSSPALSCEKRNNPALARKTGRGSLSNILKGRMCAMAGPIKNVPIGQILVENGFINEKQLNEALEK